MFEVLDCYEGYEVIGTYDDVHEACAFARQRVADTDGECYIEVVDLADGTPVDWEAY